MTILLRDICFTAVVTVATAAHADDAPSTGATTGRFPLLTVAVQGGMDLTPVGFTDSNGAPDPESATSGIVGPDVVADFDARGFLLELEGLYNPLGDLRWTARAHLTFGYRTKHNLIASISDSPVSSSGEFTRTTTIYTNRYVPMYMGLTGGVSLWGFDTTTYSSFDSGGSRPPATLPVVDVGLAIQSPQLLLAIAPEYDPSGGHLGMHYAFGIGFPVGDHMLSMRFSADQLFGDDPVDNSGRRTQVLVMFSLGLSTSIGMPGL